MVTTTKKAEAPTGLDAIAAQAEDALQPPPLGDGVTDLDAAHADGQAVPKMTNADGLLMTVGILRGTLTGMAKLESPNTVLADDLWRDACKNVGDVLTKSGIELGDAVKDWGLEIKAAATVGPLLWAAYSAIKAEVKAKDAAAAQQPAAGLGTAPPPAAPKPDAAPPPMAQVVG